MGRTVTGSLDLTSEDPRCPEALSLLAGIDLASVPAGLPHPDMYCYEFTVDGVVRTVPEHLLPDALRRLAILVLPVPGT